MANFQRNWAVVIGINDYQNQVPKLKTAKNDAKKLADILAESHEYEVILITDDTDGKPTLESLLNLLTKQLPEKINKDDRLLFYFAGHGIAKESDRGPAGFLVPQDADLKNNANLLPMQTLHERLKELKCRHLLVILDCCFAGTFRWSSTRLAKVHPRVLHKEHYDRFINSPAWQAITSASHNQEALDVGLDIGVRLSVAGTNHSPFAEALFKALQGEADIIPAAKNGKPPGDGVITATELYLYLRDCVEMNSKERQTPGLWPLPKHDCGEYIFLVPGADLKLKPAPKLNENNNPYRGLKSFEEEHAQFFFGRQELVQELYARISPSDRQFTVVAGVSGSGKSSLVKAGLIPLLRKDHQGWHVLKPMRPSESPFTALARTIFAIAGVTVTEPLEQLNFLSEVLQKKNNELEEKVAESSYENGEESAETLRLKQESEKFASIIQTWKYGSQETKQLLVVEYFEELNTLCPNDPENEYLKQAFINCLNPLSQRLQSDPKRFAEIIAGWSAKHPGVKLLLSIDQFEELITLRRSDRESEPEKKQQKWQKFLKQLGQNSAAKLSQTQEGEPEAKPEEWEQFLKVLEVSLASNLPQLRIVVTLRADFEPRFLKFEALESYWTEARFPVRPMRSDELRQAIEGPANEMALYFEPPNLADRLMDEVGGALPLLSFTLSELYIKLHKKWVEDPRITDRALRIDAEFDREGGVEGLLKRRANDEYDRVPEEYKELPKDASQAAIAARQATMRRVMLRMVALQGKDLARRPVPQSELNYLDESENKRVQEVIQSLSKTRLIVEGTNSEGEPYVELAHDFLIQRWDKLQDWVEKEKQNLLLQRRLTLAAGVWKNNQDAGFLWDDDPHLDVLKEVLNSPQNWLNLIEAEFVERSIKQKKKNITLRWSIGSSTFLALSSLTLIIIVRLQLTELSQKAARVKELLNSPQPLEGLILAIQATGQSQTILKPLLQAAFGSVESSLAEAIEVVKERNKFSDFGDPSAVAISGDGQYIAASNYDGTLKVWNSQKHEPIHSFSVLKVVKSIVFSPDSQKILTIDEENRMQIWDFQGNKVFQVAKQGINAAAFRADGQIVVTGSAGSPGKVQFWGIGGNFIGEFSLPISKKTVKSVAFSPDSTMIGFTSEDSPNILHLWNLQDASKNYSWQFQDNVDLVTFTNDGQRIISISSPDEGNVDGQQIVRLWNLKGHLLNQLDFPGHMGGVSADGRYGVTANGGSEAKLALWDLQSNAIGVFSKNNAAVNSVAFNPDNKIIVSQIKDTTVELRDLQRNLIAQPLKHKNTVNLVAISADGQTIATGSDKTVELWDLQGNSIGKISPDINISSIAVSSDRQTVAIGSSGSGGGVQLWDLQGNLIGDSVENLRTSLRQVNSVAISLDGHTIATASDDQTVRLWDRQGNPIGQPFQVESPLSVALSHDGQYIVSGSYDGTVRLWNRHGNVIGQPLKGHKKAVTSVALSRDSHYIVSDSDDGTVRFWRVENLQTGLQVACARLRYHPFLNEPSFLTKEVNRGTRETCQKFVWK